MSIVGSRTNDMNSTYTVIDQIGEYILSLHDLGSNNIEYVTHWYDQDRNGSSIGHYFSSYHDAYNDLMKRAGVLTV